MSDATPAEVEAVRAGCESKSLLECAYARYEPVTGASTGCGKGPPCLHARMILAALRHPTPARPAPPESEVEAVARAIFEADEIIVAIRQRHKWERLFSQDRDRYKRLAVGAIAALAKVRAARGVAPEVERLTKALTMARYYLKNDKKLALEVIDRALSATQEPPDAAR